MNIRVTEQQNKRGFSAVAFSLEAAVLLHVALWLALSSMFGWPATVFSVLLMALLPAAMVLLSRQKVVGKYLAFYTLVLTSVVVLVGFKFFSNAFLQLLNTAGNTVNETNGFRFVPFATDIPSGREGLYLLGAQVVCMLVTSVLLAQASVRKRLLPAVLLVTVPLLSGLLLGVAPHLILLALLLLALVLFWLHCVAGTVESGFAESGLLRQTAAGALAVLAVFTLAGLQYHGSPAVASLRADLAERIADYRYAPETEVKGMPGGDLNEAESLSYHGDTVLTLTMEQPASGYLRGFVGTGFVNGAWQPIAKDAQSGKYLGLDQWLAEKNYYPQFQLGALYALDATRTGSAAQTAKVSVDNTGLSSDKLYLFYEAVPDAELLDFCKPVEQTVFAKGWHGVREYSYTSFAPIFQDYGAEDLSAWAKTLSSLEGYEEFRTAEKLYRSFVHENYLDIDDAYREVVAATGASSFGNSRYNDIVYGVRKYLQDRFTYSEQVDRLDKNADALKEFATQTRSGYDAHFATLATLMFREAGVPARYMEGYYLSPKEMEAYADTKDLELEVYDSSAHAWTEIYEDGVGWVPVEVTPGYFSLKEEETPQLTESVQRVSKRTPRPHYDTAELPEEKQPQAPEEQKKDHTVLLIVLGVVCGVLLLLAAIFGRREYVKRKLLATDSPEATRYGYRFLMKQFQKRGMEVDPEEPYDAVETLGEEFREYLDLVYRDIYSDVAGQLTSEERAVAADYVIRQWQSPSSKL